ncbi:MAG TPA: zinc ribbon domain-containing protein [Pyrinomonadaceae bacterium]|nr:zinc ribbon domain-containing protein [Pyrinomonadaceae bacterium]
MTQMYCPQCGRELDLDSSGIRFCRYCGFSLLDTKESLQGYSPQKRAGFSIVAWSYALLLIVTLLLHGGYVSLNTRWLYWLVTILIVVSVSFFTSAAVSAMRPDLFSKRRDKALPETRGVSGQTLRNSEGQDTSLLEPPKVPVTDGYQGAKRKPVNEAPSIVEGTTRNLDNRSQSE